MHTRNDSAHDELNRLWREGVVVWDESDRLVRVVDPTTAKERKRAVYALKRKQRQLVRDMADADFSGPVADVAHDDLIEVEHALVALLRR